MIFGLGILWIVLTICLYIAIVRLTKSLTPASVPSLFSRNLRHHRLRSHLVVLGFAAVPAPASLIISLALLHPDSMKPHTAGNFKFAAFSFVITLGIWIASIAGGPKPEPPLQPRLRS